MPYVTLVMAGESGSLDPLVSYAPV